MAHGKMKSVYGIYKKHGRDQFLDAAGYYSCHVHPESIDKTIDEMESRWYDATHRQTEAEKMVEDYNNGLTVLNDASLAYVDTGFGADQIAGYALCKERPRRRSRILESALRQCGASRSEGAEAESGAETCRGGDQS